MPAWRVGRDGKPLRSDCASLPVTDVGAGLPASAATTAHQFEKDWRRYCLDHQRRYMYLRRFDAHALQSIFKVEVKGTVLADLLRALATCWLPYAEVQDVAAATGVASCNEAEPTSPVHSKAALLEAMWVLEVLQALALCGRFELSLKLLPAAVKAVTSQLFEDLAGALALESVDGFTADAVRKCATRFGCQIECAS